MSSDPKAYDPKTIEEKWYSFWENNNFFKPDEDSKKPPFSIVIPPPNVTGQLHMGHALVDTLQDVLIRFKRMSGYNALWVPGTDHAGIATQTIVEKQLIQTLNKRRFDFSREEFLDLIWKWKNEKESIILNQLKKLGCSCDWSKLRFTMDEEYSKSVRTIFKKMFDDGLIYRGNYLINYDPLSQTALADDEIEYEEMDSFLWYFKYPIKNEKGYVVIATTRPETLLGDTAVAVNPKDPRYQELIGKELVLPIMNRSIPIIDDDMVKPEFGSGAVKITPAHDFNDYDMARRHDLPMINIMSTDGTINENGKEFFGLSMPDARKAVVEKMQKLGLLEKIEPYKLRVGLSYRSKAIIQPYLSLQWFIKMTPFKNKLMSVVKEKKVKLIPPHWEEVYFHWIDNLRDWCISRQLWWGHRIPIWYNKEDESVMICHAEEGVPEEVLKNPEKWRQDEDVLDTWFSSALWPFAVFGWPNKTNLLKQFFPTAILVTGHDILFFWVARMILMAEYALKEVPFKEAFIHGLIYGKSYWRVSKDSSIAYVGLDEKVKYDLGEKIPSDIFSKWEKMSKSKGNVIDPLEIIREYGTDAMRIALCSSVTYARQIDLDRRKFDEYKNFANKIWNGTKFVLQNLLANVEKKLPALTSKELLTGLNKKLLTLEDKWILSSLNKTIKNVTLALNEYKFDRAACIPYEFFWDDFCAYYVEMSKPYLFGNAGDVKIRQNKQKILLIVLTASIRLLHPIAPFITEEIFSLIKQNFQDLSNPKSDPYTNDLINALSAKACIVTNFPKVLDEKDISEPIEADFALLKELFYAIRNIRAEMKINPGVKVDLFIYSDEEKNFSLAKENEHLFPTMAKVNKIHFILDEKLLPKMGSIAVVKNLKIFIPLPKELIDQEKTRLFKEQDKYLKIVQGTQEKLNNEEFVLKAPKEIVEKMKITLQDAKNNLLEISAKLNTL
ncbi:MAG: valine--tRNA ligase [Chlamydiae bacterium]|nr:valine--tRNA ligase [Chlamydiota bacterium]